MVCSFLNTKLRTNGILIARPSRRQIRHREPCHDSYVVFIGPSKCMMFFRLPRQNQPPTKSEEKNRPSLWMDKLQHQLGWTIPDETNCCEVDSAHQQRSLQTFRAAVFTTRRVRVMRISLMTPFRQQLTDLDQRFGGGFPCSTTSSGPNPATPLTKGLKIYQSQETIELDRFSITISVHEQDKAGTPPALATVALMWTEPKKHKHTNTKTRNSCHQ